MTIRVLTSKDAEAYRQLRLKGLQEIPIAFGARYEDEVQFPLEKFVERITPDLGFFKFALGAFDENNRLVGIISFRRYEGERYQHKGCFYGTYVDSDRQREGIGKKLFEKAFSMAKEAGIKILFISVFNKVPAIHFYRSLGFESYGVEKYCMLHEGIYYDLELMAKSLDPSAMPLAAK